MAKSGIRGGESSWFSNFATTEINTQVNLSATDSSTARWRIFEYKSLKKNSTLIEKVRRERYAVAYLFGCGTSVCDAARYRLLDEQKTFRPQRLIRRRPVSFASMRPIAIAAPTAPSMRPRARSFVNFSFSAASFSATMLLRARPPGTKL